VNAFVVVLITIAISLGLGVAEGYFLATLQ
jgi:uncharacterized protein YneF (UPF0154 family)